MILIVQDMEKRGVQESDHLQMVVAETLNRLKGMVTIHKSSQGSETNQIGINFNYLILFSIVIVIFLFSKSLYYSRTDNTDSAKV